MTDTLTKFHKERYGAWAGDRHGRPAVPGRCCVEVLAEHRFHQCGNRRGHGPEGAYCRIHDPAARAARAAAADKKYNEEFNRRLALNMGRRFLEVLRQIADGHNDPRALAREAVEDYEGKLKK